MKNTIRVRKNRSASRPTPQVKTSLRKPTPAKPDKQFRLPKDAKHHICLAVFDREEQELVGKIPLTEKELADFWELGIRGRLKSKCIDENVAELIREKLKHDQGRNALLSFDETIHKAIALIDLFESKLVGLMPKGNVPPSSPDYDALVAKTFCGLLCLSHQVKKNLSEGFDMLVAS